MGRFYDHLQAYNQYRKKSFASQFDINMNLSTLIDAFVIQKARKDGDLPIFVFGKVARDITPAEPFRTFGTVRVKKLFA